MLFSSFQTQQLHRPWLKQKPFGNQTINAGKFWYPEDLFVSWVEVNNSICMEIFKIYVLACIVFSGWEETRQKSQLQPPSMVDPIIVC